MRENRETPLPPVAANAAGRWGKAMSHKTHVHDSGESYNGIRPAKQPNKRGRPPAEAVEERPLTKENAGQPNPCWTPSQGSGPSGLDRVREAAKKDRKTRFTALLHHVTADLLRESYHSLKKKIDTISSNLRKILDEVIDNGGTVATYGASATSTVLNSLLGLNHLVSFIVDDNLLRKNRLSPGFMVPVHSSDALDEYRPTCVVISAWRFAGDIVERNKKYLSAGGRFIVPLPFNRSAGS